MNAPVTAIRRGRKFDQVLEGAREVFMTDGFHGASVDDIARVAGVSKATLYSYFPDKRLLFTEVATTECRRQADEAVHDIDMSRPPREVLTRAGTHLLGFLLSKFGQQVFRICVAESDRFPELGREFYNCGPRVVRDILTQYFLKSMDRGELQIEDPRLAADQFAELCKTDLWTQMVFGIRSEFSPEDINRIVQGAVDTFMARYDSCRSDLPIADRA